MTKSTITRERLEALANAEYCKSNPGAWLLGLKEVNELARMALVAMDSEPVEMPLDYLQGHKDGLEWASQLAEANHPETGDWLYDDPIELAKAIRKGPDMPPEQPVEDSEPDRNPVLAYADSYRDMAKQGVESVPIWSVITDLERNIAPLYRHAQQPVVPATLPCSVELKPGLIIGKGCKTETLLTALRRRADYNADIDAMTPEERAEYDANIEAFKAMLPQPAPVVMDERAAFNAWNNEDNLPIAGVGAKNAAWLAWQARAMLQAGTLTNEDTRQVDELTMWIKRLVRSLKNANPDSKLPREAMDYLTAKGLISVGDALR
ncbi:hypothetical protein ACI8EP_29165 [Klebsiella michiganensis]